MKNLKTEKGLYELKQNYVENIFFKNLKPLSHLMLLPKTFSLTLYNLKQFRLERMSSAPRKCDTVDEEVLK